MSIESHDGRGGFSYAFSHFTSIRLSILLVFLTYLGYRFSRRILEYRADTEFGIQNGCKPITSKLSYKWPLALDIVKQGNAANNNKRLLALISTWFNELGPNVELIILGGMGYMTMDPENIESVLSSQFEDFEIGIRGSAMHAMLGDGIFTQDGAAWKHSRELLRRQFVRMQYQNLEGFREHVENLVDVLRPSRGVVDLQPLFQRLTLDTTTAMILGQSVNSLKNEEGDMFPEYFNEASLVTASRVRFGDLYFLCIPPGFHAACKAVKSYTDRFVKDAMQSEGCAEKETTSDRVAFIKDLYSEYQDSRLVRDQVLNVLLAGRDTTASLISYAFRALVRYPEVQKKLRKEIEHVLGQDKVVTRAHIRRMTYLECVIKETLRLFTPAPINGRFAKKTTVLPRGGGPDGRSPSLIRRGRPVAFSLYHMHRRKDLYGPDAGDFRPERWENSGLADIKWGFLPFNGGPRICLGNDFAIMLASYAIARIIQSFPKIELPPGEKWEEPGSERQQLTLVLSCADGCKVVLG